MRFAHKLSRYRKTPAHSAHALNLGAPLSAAAAPAVARQGDWAHYVASLRTAFQSELGAQLPVGSFDPPDPLAGDDAADSERPRPTHGARDWDKPSSSAAHAQQEHAYASIS